MLPAATNLSAAALASPVVQPQRNSTDIVLRVGSAEHMEEPFRSHLSGTLAFIVVHPSAVKGSPIKDLVYHPMNTGFNFMGIQMLGEINTGKSQGVLHIFADGSDPQDSYMAKYGAAIARAWNCSVDQLRLIRNDFGPGEMLVIPDRMRIRMMVEAGIGSNVAAQFLPAPATPPRDVVSSPSPSTAASPMTSIGEGRIARLEGVVDTMAVAMSRIESLLTSKPVEANAAGSSAAHAAPALPAAAPPQVNRPPPSVAAAAIAAAALVAAAPTAVAPAPAAAAPAAAVPATAAPAPAAPVPAAVPMVAAPVAVALETAHGAMDTNPAGKSPAELQLIIAHLQLVAANAANAATAAPASPAAPAAAPAVTAAPASPAAPAAAPAATADEPIVIPDDNDDMTVMVAVGHNKKLKRRMSFIKEEAEEEEAEEAEPRRVPKRKSKAKARA
jgi:hypothetical protein